MSIIKYEDLMLPNQAFLRRDFKGGEGDLYPAILEAIVSSTDMVTPAEEFSLVHSERFSTEEMASHPILLQLLQFLIKLSGSRNILEIGAFIGVSAMSMARALPATGSLTSIEKFSEFAAICRKNFENNKLAHKIKLLEGDAADVLPTLSGQSFDFIFLDGNKERYEYYFQLLDELLNPGGLIIADNMFCCGDTLNNPPETEKALGVRKFLSHVKDRKDYGRVFLPIYDGVMVMRKNNTRDIQP